MKKSFDESLVPIRIRKGDFISMVLSAYREEGLYYILRTAPKYLSEVCFDRIPNYISFCYYNWFKSSETFYFDGDVYNYLFHPYCNTWKNERCAVIPIVWNKVLEYQERGKNILEIGNMTSYFYNVEHDILDKYEVTNGVINEDVVDFHPSKKYDFIFSIMALQYVGWFESPRDHMKTLRAVENLKSILAPGGIIMIIHGLGENKAMDELLKSGRFKFTKEFYLRKLGGYKWTESDWENVKDLNYDNSAPTANGVFIGFIETKSNTDSDNR
jgi:hypothetical protein